MHVVLANHITYCIFLHSICCVCRPALLEHMPLIETHHHTLQNGLAGEEDDLLGGGLGGGDAVSQINQHNLQQTSPQTVLTSLCYVLCTDYSGRY
jgi:hypothetical protein